MDDARTHLRERIREAGGVTRVAQAVGCHRATIYRHLAGGDLEPEYRMGLRAALPDVPAEVWAALYAPAPTKVAP